MFIDFAEPIILFVILRRRWNYLPWRATATINTETSGRSSSTCTHSKNLSTEMFLGTAVMSILRKFSIIVLLSMGFHLSLEVMSGPHSSAMFIKLPGRVMLKLHWMLIGLSLIMKSWERREVKMKKRMLGRLALLLLREELRRVVWGVRKRVVLFLRRGWAKYIMLWTNLGKICPEPSQTCQISTTTQNTTKNWQDFFACWWQFDQISVIFKGCRT